MLSPTYVIKKTAKTSLKDNWFQAIAVSLIFIFALCLGEVAASLVFAFAKRVGYIIFLSLFNIFAIFPLLLGVINWFRRLLWGQKDNVLLVFKYFSNRYEYKRALHLSLILTSKLLICAAIIFSPCIIVWVLSSERFYNFFDLSLPVWTSSLWTLNSFLAIISSFALIFVALKYYLAPFLFVSDDNMHPAEAINMSVIISRRTGSDFVALVLSFALWILLSVFVAPLIFTIPYFIAAYGVHCRYAVTAYNNDVDNFNSKDAPFYSVDEV